MIGFKLTSKKTGRVYMMTEISVCNEYSCLTFDSNKEEEQGISRIDEFSDFEHEESMNDMKIEEYFDIEIIKDIGDNK